MPRSIASSGLRSNTLAWARQMFWGLGEADVLDRRHVREKFEVPEHHGDVGAPPWFVLQG